MLISYNWLRELTGTALSPQDLRERLTMVGLAIDAVAKIGGDSVLDVEVPSNRPDCLSHVGIAREVSVIEQSNVQSPTSKVFATEGKASDFTSVEISDRDLCPRYAARVVRGVKIGRSPEWLAKRLGEIGQRPINNVADITNYVLHELGQPLHAFDLAKLTEERIVVRRATAGEKLTTLDGVARQLDTEMLVIADARHPVALAGIMGGLDSEISDDTTDVLIESAYFDPDSVRRTARKLGMDTEASRRFERGADCENVLKAQARCVELICEIAGGVATSDAIDVYPNPLAPRSVNFRPARVESLTSLRLEEQEMMRVLELLGFTQGQPSGASVTDPGSASFIVPSWRVDVSIEEDLVEEVARHAGFDKIASQLPPSNVPGEYQPSEMSRRGLRTCLTNLGFNEAINLSFIDTAHDDQFETLPGFVSESSEAGLVALSNPILEHASRMRTSLMPGLLDSVRHNLNHGMSDVRLFEIGRIFAASGSGEVPREREAWALIATGGAIEEGHAQATRDIDFFELKGALEAGVEAMKLGPLSFANANVKHLREGQAAKIEMPDGNEIGTIGRLAETVAAAYKFRQPVFLAELDLSVLLDAQKRPIQYRPLPRYPSVVRDLTLLVNRDVTLAEMFHAIKSASVADFAGARLVGTYEGKSIPAGKRSVTLRIEYRSDERTLRDDELEERNRKVIDTLLQQFSAELH